MLINREDTKTMFIKLVIIFLFNLVFMLSCDSEKSISLTKEDIVEDEKHKIQIKSFLTNCQITLSTLSGAAKLSGYSEGTIKLNEQLMGFSGSVRIFARVRGVLLENSRVLTSLKVYYGSSPSAPAQRIYDTYASLFNGTTKKLIGSVFLGTGLDVISVLKKNAESEDDLIVIDALFREKGQPASEIKKFTIKVEGETITLQ